MNLSTCRKEKLITFVLISISSSLISCTNLNNPPQIIIGLPYSQIKKVLTLAEDTPINTFLALLETKDADSGLAGEVECRTDNAFINITLVFPKTYKIELANELDRETISSFQVQIVCSDKGTPALTANDEFTVSVVDINDNSPIFGSSSYTFNVTEGAGAGTLVAVINATDPDSELNGVVRYSFPNDSYVNVSCFTIDEETGYILTSSEIDREKVSQYTLTVVATDSGSPARSSNVQVQINVDDINDNPPVITTKEIHVKENQKSMVTIGKVVGSDLDSGKNAQLVFSKVENSRSPSMTPFLVQPNGEVLSAVSLNREQMPRYTMEVEVKDKGTPRKSSTATVVIIVDDVNDNTPVITSLCFYDYILENNTLIDNSSIGNGVVVIDWFMPDEKKVVYQVKAEDEDVGDNAQIRFSIESSTSGNRSHTTAHKDSLFRINETTGEIFLKRVVKKSDHLHQILNVSASDKGEPPLTSFCALSITIKVDVKQLGIAKTTVVKGKSHKRTRKHRNRASCLGFVRVKHLFGEVSGVACYLIACIVVNYVFRI